MIPFLKKTRPNEWAALEKLRGERTEKIVLDDLWKALDSQGTLPVIRHGFKCFGKRGQLDRDIKYRSGRLEETRPLPRYDF